MKKIFLFVFALSVISVSKAQYLLVENYQPKEILENGQPNILKIPFSKYQFDNGLTLIVSENHSNPIVNVNITYKVGSSNDYADRTGMSYLIYTLMEGGATKHLQKGYYERMINRYGGKRYSEITRDKTSFSSTVPKNLLSTVLWMESDRQAYFLDSLTKERFDNAKLDIIAKIYDSLYHKPYGLTDVIAQKNLYPYAHPYTWPEFGMMDDYQIYQLPDLKKFFLDWYGTNNTIITITGDVTVQEATMLVNQYFGSLTKAPQTPAYVDDIVSRILQGAGDELTEPRYISYKLDVANPYLKIVFNTVPKYHNDEKALNVIASVLGQGSNSILYNEFVKTGYAVYVNARHTAYKYNGEFSIDIMASKDTSLAVIVKKLNALFNNIVINGDIYPKTEFKPPVPGMPPHPVMQPKPEPQGFVPPQPYIVPTPEQRLLNESRSADAIFKSSSGLKTFDICLYENLQNIGEGLSDRELINGKPSELSASLGDYDKINPQTFFTFFNQYIINSPKLYVSYIPKAMAQLVVAPDNIKEMELQTILTPTKDSELVYRYPAREINSKQPKIKDIPINIKLDSKTEPTPFGMSVTSVPSTDFPLVCLNLRMNTNRLMKLMPNVDVSKMIAWLYTQWFDKQGNDNPLKAATITGSIVQFSPDNEYVNIRVICSREHLMLVKEAFLQLFYRQDFGTEPIKPEFTRYSEDPELSSKFEKSNFDDVIRFLSDNKTDNRLNRDSFAISGVNKKQTRITYSDLFTPKNISVSVLGDIDEGQYRDLYQNLARWQPMPGEIVENPEQQFQPDSININDLKSSPSGNIYFLPDRNKEKAIIIVEYMQFPVDVNQGYYTGAFANFMFGISSVNYLTSKLKSFDYINSLKIIKYYRNKEECYSAVLTVNADKFVDAYNNLMLELANFKTFKPDKKQFNLIKTEYLYKNATDYESIIQKDQLCNYLLSNKISNEVINNQYAFTKKIKASKITKFWSATYNIQKQRVIVIGNESNIPVGISATGNKMVLINRTGTVINY
jgi:zinc protease